MIGAGAEVFAIWGYVIANTIQSKVELNPRLLSPVLGIPKEKVETAITFLCTPDPESRNKEHDGCRLVREAQFQYYVPTHAIYRSILNEDERRNYNRMKQREFRNSKRMSNSLSMTVNDMSALSAHTEAEADTNKETTLLGKPNVSKLEMKKNAEEVLQFLNERTGRNYQPTETNLSFIAGRLKTGATVAHCRSIIAKKLREWKGTEMEIYLRPATLFNKTKFDQYFGELIVQRES